MLRKDGKMLLNSPSGNCACKINVIVVTLSVLFSTVEREHVARPFDVVRLKVEHEGDVNASDEESANVSSMSFAADKMKMRPPNCHGKILPPSKISFVDFSIYMYLDVF
jgi:hypothetical protein